MGALVGLWMMVLGGIQGHFYKTPNLLPALKQRFPIFLLLCSFCFSQGESLIWLLLGLNTSDT